MPILMVAHSTINNLNFSDSDLSEEPKPLDFTMSKFKSSSPNKHPLYHHYYGSNSDTSPNRDEKDEQGESEECQITWTYREITHNTFREVILIPTKRSSGSRDFLIEHFIHFLYQHHLEPIALPFRLLFMFPLVQSWIFKINFP